ncbi:hypothetical protein KSP39_PZI013713 [Platanthera zijinensis]|uniref:Uncharacterized protein n=1 Tax=Platanthera zijinensis TaxID=2320716 RepID=A0AAP0BEL0_9ASPA
MALLCAAASSKPRRPKAFAIRSFPPLCGPASSSAAPPPTNSCLISDRNVPPIRLIDLSPEPTSCGPGSGLRSYQRKIIRPPSAFAIRSFPRGCGPLSAAISKPQLSKEASAVGRGNPKEESELEKITEEDVVGKSVCENDLQKPNRTSSHVRDLAQAGRLCSTEGSDSNNEVEEMEEKLNEVVRRITEGVSSQGKVTTNAVIGRFLGEKNGEKFIKKSYSEKDGENSRKGLGEKDGEKPVRKSLTNFLKDGKRFSSPASLEPKKELNSVTRRFPEGGSDSGKIAKNFVVGRSLDEKNGKKTGGKRSFVPDLVKGGRSQKSQLVEVRHERLVVQALMAAKRCPWMQGKGKGSIGSQPRRKKLKS